MNHLSAAFAWLNDPLNWTGPGGLLERLQEHLVISGLAVLLACAVGWPLGAWLGHRGRGNETGGPTLALPALALVLILPLGSGRLPVVVALTVLAVPPLLTSARAGLRQADPETREAAVGMGLSGGQLLRRVELPLALPFLAAGLRTAAVRVVATAALAALVNGGGLGEIISAGFGTSAGGQVVAGGIVVALLALLVEGVLAVVQRAVTPRGVRRVRAAAAAPAG